MLRHRLLGWGRLLPVVAVPAIYPAWNAAVGLPIFLALNSNYDPAVNGNGSTGLVWLGGFLTIGLCLLFGWIVLGEIGRAQQRGNSTTARLQPARSLVRAAAPTLRGTTTAVAHRRHCRGGYEMTKSQSAAPNYNAVTTSDHEPRGTEWALGPGAVSWEVLRNPAVFVIALLREGILLTLHPQFAAAAVDHDRVHQDPVKRYRTIAQYAYSVVYGTPAQAERVSGYVRRSHRRVVGVEPITGRDYRAHSDYELVLTQVLLSSSWIAAYEAINGRLSDGQRDQFLMEQKVAGALLGIRPEHLPGTMTELEDFLAYARKKWAAGWQARRTLRPFAYGDYPAGSIIGELPPLKRKAVSRAVRALTDITLLTMHPADLELLAIDRRPQLRSRVAVRGSLRALAAYMGSQRGREGWERFMGKGLTAIMERARAAELAAGGHAAAAASFVVPDATQFVATLEDRMENMPADAPVRGILADGHNDA